MTLAQLKEWVNSLPEELLEFPVVYGVEGEIEEELFYRADHPIVSALVDMDTEEVILLSAIEDDELAAADIEEIKNLLPKLKEEDTEE